MIFINPKYKLLDIAQELKKFHPDMIELRYGDYGCEILFSDGTMMSRSEFKEDSKTRELLLEAERDYGYF